ncbi:MAG: hypothetical protein HY257_08150 [Chloroflexi bacterium]|nr:hypothetical protein [Chloroflexota bacterium]
MRRVLFGILFALIGASGLALAGIASALVLENQDSFCAACHTEPEVTFFQRASQEKKVDLAAYHTAEKTRCIDCHSGSGLFGRVKGLQQGAHDLLTFLSGNYHKPAITTNPLGDDACIKCHTNVEIRPPTASRTGTGHYHYFLPQWQMEDRAAAQCITCHPSHLVGIERLAFMPQGKVGETCDQCHTALSGKIK